MTSRPRRSRLRQRGRRLRHGQPPPLRPATRRVLLLPGHAELTTAQGRLRGAQRAFEAYGVPVRPGDGAGTVRTTTSTGTRRSRRV
ncbi:hypothetical protein ACRAWF_47305 [Streptomyces sp. L7]